MNLKGFPSPIGELHFSIIMQLQLRKEKTKFPSPIGELHFSIEKEEAIDIDDDVSVPYRGATFLNSK